MTDREKIVVSAHTGVVMLPEDKVFMLFDYFEELLGRRITIYDLQFKEISDQIKERSKAEFLEICNREEESDDG